MIDLKMQRGDPAQVATQRSEEHGYRLEHGN